MYIQKQKSWQWGPIEHLGVRSEAKVTLLSLWLQPAKQVTMTALKHHLWLSITAQSQCSASAWASLSCLLYLLQHKREQKGGEMANGFTMSSGISLIWTAMTQNSWRRLKRWNSTAAIQIYLISTVTSILSEH